MLAKLMKYDLRSCLRKFGPLWLAVIALSALIGLSFRYIIDAPGGQSGLVIFLLGVLPSMVLFGLFVAMAVMALIFIIQRFYRGLLGDEGYLMFTLPASAGAHIASKGLTALILEILSWLAAVLSGVLLFTVYQPTEFARGWQTIWMELGKLQLPPSTPWLVAEAVLVLIAVAATETLKIYLAIALGHLAKKHRALWALLAYVGIGLVLNILFGVGMNSGLLPRILGKSFSWGFRFVEGALTLDSPGVAAGALGSALLFELLLGAAYFFLTRWILKRHLNLE